MRLALVLTALALLLAAPAGAVLPAVESPDYAASGLAGPWIDGTPLLEPWVERYRDALDAAEPLPARKAAVPVGGVETFWTMDLVKNQPIRVEAVLRAIGKTHYLYVEKGRECDEATLAGIVEKLDGTIYPEDTSAFGFEWKPGIDGDERITVLMLDVRDGWEPGKGYVGGYYFPLNEVSTKVFAYSNEREMIYLDMYPSNPKDPFYLGVIAHEFQHMIHKNHDPKEDKFLNEGMSQLAFYVCGYDHPSQVLGFLGKSGKQLNKWENTIEDYGAVYLWNYYLWTKWFGRSEDERKAFTRFLVDSPAKNLAGYDEAFRRFGIDADVKRVFRDWVVANYINDPAFDPRYGYDETLRCTLHSTDRVTTFPWEARKRKLAPWAAHYLKFAPVIEWYPEKPSAYEKFRVQSRKADSIRWTVNGGKVADAKFWPAGSALSPDGRSVVTPLGAVDETGHAWVEVGPLASRDPIESFEFRFVIDGASADRVNVVDIINKELRAPAPARAEGAGTLTLRVAGGSDGKPLELAVIRKLAACGYRIDRVVVTGKWELVVDDYGRATEWVALAPFHFNDKEIEYDVAAELSPKVDLDALERRAAHYLEANRALMAAGGADEETRALATLAAADLSRARAALEAAGGEEGGRRFRALAEGETGPAERKADGADDAHDNFIYLGNKLKETVHGLTHLKIDPKFLEGEILNTWKILQLTMNVPNLPIPDGFAFVDYEAESLLAAFDRLAAQGGPAEKDLVRRMTLAGDATEALYNESLSMSEEAGVGLYRLVKLSLSTVRCVQSVAGGLADVPVAGPLAQKVKKAVIRKSIGILNKASQFIAPKLPAPYGQFVPAGVWALTSLYAHFTHLPADPGQTGGSSTVEFGAKTFMKYLLASLPKVGFVRITQPSVDGIAERASHPAAGTIDEALRVVSEGVAGEREDVARVARQVRVERESADISGAIGQIAVFTSAVDPTVISKVVAVAGNALAGGLYVHSIWLPLEKFYALPAAIRRLARAAFDPAKGDALEAVKVPAAALLDAAALDRALAAWEKEAGAIVDAARAKDEPAALAARVDALLAADDGVERALGDYEALMKGGSIRGMDDYFAALGAILDASLARGGFAAECLAYVAAPSAAAAERLAASRDAARSATALMASRVKRTAAEVDFRLHETYVEIAGLSAPASVANGERFRLSVALRAHGFQAGEAVVRVRPCRGVALLGPAERIVSLGGGGPVAFELVAENGAGYPIDGAILVECEGAGLFGESEMLHVEVPAGR